MRRILTFAICLLSLQFTNAKATGLPADSSLTVKRATAYDPYANNLTKLRLDAIRKEIQLDYNPFVQAYIDLYTRHKDEMSQVLGLSKYYFPIYEKIFREAGIPTEIKYLSIVESKLNPHAVSRVGATGPWQFMGPTAKIYGLTMNGDVDDRKDPIQSCYAAAAYLKDAYMEFGDWLVAIASYNCGKSNVERAIEKSGSIDFWAIREFLPIETRGYVPAFIAMNYVMNYPDKHNIYEQPWALSTKTDTVMVDKNITLSNIAKAIGVELKDLTLFNPSYKRLVVNGSKEKPRRIVIPNHGGLNNAVLYEALNNPSAIIAQQPMQRPIVIVRPVISPEVEAVMSENAIASLPITEPTTHKVKRGESWVDIASTYGIDIADLKKMNGMYTARPTAGALLKLTLETDVAPIVSNTTAAIATVTAAKKPTTSYITYRVQPGDTINGIAEKFKGTTTESIRSLNGLKEDALQPGMTLMISKG